MERLSVEEWERRCENAGPRLARVLQRRATALALKMQSRAVGNATKNPRSRTGALRRSIAGRVVQTGRTLARVEGVSSQVETSGRAMQGAPLSVFLSAGGRTGGKNLIYARIQDQGGVVRPVRAKWLAIPTDSVKTPGGAARYASPRDYPNPLRFQYLFFGLAALIEDKKNADGVVRWWLRKKTTIPASKFAQKAWLATRREVPRTLDDAVRVAMDVPGSITGEAR